MKILTIDYSRIVVKDEDEKYLRGEDPVGMVITRERTESYIYTETYKCTAKNLGEAMSQIINGEVEPSERETDDDEEYSDYTLELVVVPPSPDETEDNTPMDGQIDIFGNVIESEEKP